MVVDYKSIADRAEQIIGSADPSQYMTAYNAMVNETTTRQKPGEVRMNRRMLMRELGAFTADSLLQKIKTGIDGSSFTTDTKTYLFNEINGEGIDLNHPETQQMLQSFVSAGVMTQTDYDQIMALTQEIISTWPDLKPGQVQNALELRAAGEI